MAKKGSNTTPESALDMIELELTSICKRIYFDFDESECLIFATANEIIQYNFMKKTRDQLYDFADFDE